MQGYAEVADVAYVGCGILASAAAMDKDVAKRLLREAGIPVARSITLLRGEAGSFQRSPARSACLLRQAGAPGLVLRGQQVNDRDGFGAAVDMAFRYDGKALIEEFVEGREIECSVLQRADGTLTVSRPGEIIPAGKHGFYTYEAKYLDADGAWSRCPPTFRPRPPKEPGDGGRAFPERLAARRWRASTSSCAPMAACWSTRSTPFPGFTDISMYAKALAATGIGYGQIHRRPDRARAGKARGALIEREAREHNHSPGLDGGQRFVARHRMHAALPYPIMGAWQGETPHGGQTLETARQRRR